MQILPGYKSSKFCFINLNQAVDGPTICHPQDDTELSVLCHSEDDGGFGGH